MLNNAVNLLIDTEKWGRQIVVESLKVVDS